MAGFADYLLVSVVTGEDVGNQNKTVVSKVYENGTVEFLQVIDPENLAVQSTAIFHKGEDVRLSLAGDNGVYIYEYSEVDSQFMRIQTIPAMDVFLVEQLEMFGEDILILGLLGTSEGPSGAMLAAYRWMGGYFDSFFEYAVPHIRDICPFEIQGHFFLAVAVQEIGKSDRYHDLSFIMRYDLHTDVFVVNQYIPTHGARDFEFFSISSNKDQEFFLALAVDQLDESGNERSIVYKYIWHKFVPFQCFETHGARKWQPVTKSLDVVLILSSSHGIVFYQYDGWRFSEVGLPMLDVSLESEIQSFSAVVLNGTEYLAISPLDFLSRNSHATIFQLEFNATNSLEDYHDLLEAACLAEHEALDRAIERIENVTVELPKLVYVNVNSTQEISGNITFTENIIAEDTTVQANLSAAVGHIFNKTEAERFMEMEELADEQGEDIDWLKDRMDNMMLNIGVQTVTARKTFYDFTSTSELDASSVAVSSDIVNKYINLTDVNSNIFRVDQNETVIVPITVGGSLFADGLVVKGQIDGMLTSDLVTLTGNHTIVSSKTFGDATDIVGDVSVDGLIDGVATENILLSSTNQTIAGELTFNGPVTFGGNVIVDGETDSVDISEIEAISVYKDGTFVIKGGKTFDDDVTSGGGLSAAAGKTIDAISVEEMDANILRVTTEQNITGTYTFTSDVHVFGDVVVVGSINGLVIPDDLLLSDSSELFNISGSTTFTAALRVSDLTVEQFIDGIAATVRTSGSSRRKRSLDLPATPVWSAVGRGVDLPFPPPAICPNGWSTFDNSCYYFDEELRTFDESEAACTGSGSDLVSIHSMEEQSFLSDNLNSFHAYFIGLTDMITEGVWTFTDGSQYTFSNWDDGEPSNRSVGADCALLVGADSWGWRDVTCNEVRAGSICKKDADAYSGVTPSATMDATVYSATDFQTAYNPCDYYNPCMNGASCLPTEEFDFFCSCLRGFTGDFCDQPVSVKPASLPTTSPTSITVAPPTIPATTIPATNVTLLATTIPATMSPASFTTVPPVSDALYSKLSAPATTHHTTIHSTITRFRRSFSTQRPTFHPGDFRGLSSNSGRGKSLDLLLGTTEDDADQVLSGQITLTDDLVLMEDTTVTGLVDGVDLSELSTDAVRNNDNATVTGSKIIEGPVYFSQAISVGNLINGVNITDVDTRVLRITDSEWRPEGGLTFNAATTTLTANLETYGSHSFSGIQLTDLAKQGVIETIKGHKIFQSIHSEGMINLTGATNGLSMDKVCREAVYLNNTEAITLYGDITFEEDLSIDGDLTVDGTVDGVDLEDIVTVEGPQRIGGSTAFHSDVHVKELLVNGSVRVDNRVNDENVTEVALNTLYTHGVQTVSGHKTFLADAVFADDLELDGSVNGVDISELALDAVYITGDHAISAPKTFTSEASVGSMTIEGSVNGENFTEFCGDIVLQGDQQTITGDITFEQMVELTSSLTLDGTINGVDLAEFNSTAHKITDTEFTGQLHLADVYANASVNVDGLVVGVDVGDDTLVKNKEGQTVTGVKTFTSPVTLGDDLDSTTVDSLDIQDMDSSVLKTVGDQNVTGYYKLWDCVTWLSDATLGGLIDGVDIVELANSIWRTDGSTDDYTLNVTGNGTFNILTSKDIYYNGKIDGVDIPELNRTYVSLSLDQTITGSKRFLGDVVVEGTLSTDHIRVEGSVQDLDLKDISSEGLISGNAGQKMEGELTFVENVTFKGDVTADGTIDGVDVSDDVMVTNSRNIVRAHKTFDNSCVVVDASLVIKAGERVQQVDVSEMERLSADLYSNYTIPHSTSFTDVTLQNVNVGGHLNGINYTTSHVLTVPHDQFIYGNYTFMTDTSFSSEVTATTINGLDVVDLATNTLFTTGDQTVTANITFNDLMLAGNVTTHGLFGGVTVTDLYDSLHYYPQLDNLGVTLDEQCQVVDEIYYTQQNQAVVFRGLERIDGVVTTGSVLWVPYQNSFGNFAVLAVSPFYDENQRTTNPQVCASLSIKRWDRLQESYQNDKQMTFDLIKDVKPILGAEIGGVVVAERTVDGSCFNISEFGYSITELPDEHPTGYTAPPESWVHVMFTNDVGEPFHQRLFGVGTSTLEVISHDDYLCIFFGNEVDRATWNTAVDSFFYCFNSSSGTFQFTLSVPTFGIVKASQFSHSGSTYILAANRVDSVSRSHQVDSTLWNFINTSQVQEAGRFPTRAASYVTSGDVNGMRLIVYLNEFEGDYMFENYGQDIDIYRFDVDGTELYQKIRIYGAKAATFIELEQMDFLAVIDRNGNLTLFKYEGIQQFVEFYTLHIPGAIDIAVMTVGDSSAIHLFVATALAELPLFPWQPTIPVPSPSEVFQVVLSGHILDAVGCSSAAHSKHGATDVTSLIRWSMIHLLICLATRFTS